MHTHVSGVAHYSAKDDSDCVAIIRRLITDLPAAPERLHGNPPAKPADGLYGIMPMIIGLPMR